MKTHTVICDFESSFEDMIEDVLFVGIVYTLIALASFFYATVQGF